MQKKLRCEKCKKEIRMGYARYPKPTPGHKDGRMIDHYYLCKACTSCFTFAMDGTICLHEESRRISDAYHGRN